MNSKHLFRRGCCGAQTGNRARHSVQPNGFTLMELLIVIAIILILMLMAIPTVGSIKKQANETSAINSMRTIAQAQLQYESTFPTNGYACALASLGGDPKSGAPTATAAQFLQADLASGVKSGYIFSIGNCTKVNLNGTDRITGFQVNAIPQTVGQTGNRGFCSDQFGTIKADPAGGTNCTQPLQ
jgi:type IV pilus assembly protein PilA